MLTRIGALTIGMALLVSCGGNGDGGPAPGDRSEGLVVEAANYDLVAGQPSRFIAGVVTQDQLFVSYGTVEMAFTYLGTEKDAREGEAGPSATAHFIAISGNVDQPGPIAAPASKGRGVYEANVTFDKAGFWSVEVTADLIAGRRTGTAAFEVHDAAQFPAVGDRALRTDNLTVDSDAPRAAIDSRATEGKIPDMDLHQTTIARSIADHRPALVVFSTPVYCISRFCGPVTDMVESLAKRYSDCANFIHVEVWRNFQDTVVNKAAADWIYRNDTINEPWVYLIDRTGKIAQRWDNVVVRDEVEPALKKIACRS
ncbi:MAG TPA: hypothetical protein VFK89_01070 [Actinomycetota bacterium]|nr:hypothetical protein [Actinomycetota bacterium]